jgi:hypothetical protein
VPELWTLDLVSVMHPDSGLPNDEQRKKLCDMLHHALVDIRMLAASGHGEQASDLADAFHNLPQEIWCDYFSISFFRDAFLVPYYRKWPVRQPRDYIALLDEVERLK